MTDSIVDTLATLHRELAHYGAKVTLVAVSKQQPVTKIMQVLTAGQRVFGENRVQEARQKWPELKAQFPQAELHLIGPLQTNKLREALALFEVIETLDRYALAEALAKELPKSSRHVQLYIQVNTGNEPQKSGIAPEEADAFITYCREQLRLPVTGLMCIPPADEDPVPHFRYLKTLAETYGLQHISMGMSDDYACAIREGATHIRLGRAIFGERG